MKSWSGIGESRPETPAPRPQLGAPPVWRAPGRRAPGRRSWPPGDSEHAARRGGDRALRAVTSRARPGSRHEELLRVRSSWARDTPVTPAFRPQLGAPSAWRARVWRAPGRRGRPNRARVHTAPRGGDRAWRAVTTGSRAGMPTCRAGPGPEHPGLRRQLQDHSCKRHQHGERQRGELQDAAAAGRARSATWRGRGLAAHDLWSQAGLPT